MDGSQPHQPLSSPATSRRSHARTTSTWSVDGRNPRLPRGRLLPQRPQPAVRPARRLPLVRRRRHDPRLLRRGRQGALSQPLCPHAQVAGGERRRPALFGLFGNPDDHRPLGASARTAASPTPTSSGTPASCWRSRRATCPSSWTPRPWRSRGYAEAYRGNVTAHPKIDPVTGEMVWFAYGVRRDAASQRTVSYGVTDAAGEVVRRDDFEAPYRSMVHDFLVTERHVLFPDPAARPAACSGR